jgi:hypothetical protein
MVDQHLRLCAGDGIEDSLFNLIVWAEKDFTTYGEKQWLHWLEEVILRCPTCRFAGMG